MISDETIATLNSLNPDIKDLIQRKLKSETKLKYHPLLRTFALTLHFYSAKAYDYVRQLLLLVAVNRHLKIPVAYFLTNRLNSKEKANTISECLIKVHETGVQVISLTFDAQLQIYL